MREAAILAVVLALSLAGGPALSWLDPANPDVVTVLDAEDNQFSFYSGPGGQAEWLLNNGRASQTRVKGWQDITALKFDLSAHVGQTVEEAELHLAKSDTNPIYALVASTINTDWAEGNGWGSDAAVGESCWRWRRRPADPSQPGPDDEWTFSHSDFTTAAFGNYGSLVSFGYEPDGTFGSYDPGGQTWIRMKLDPDLVHALILDHHGLAVTDPRGHNLSYNPRVYTKEESAAVQPRLLLLFSTETDTTPPGAVTGLSAEAGPRNGEVVLHFTAPSDPESDKAFGYTVRYSTGDDFNSATDMARWRIPRPATPGTQQQTLIEGLAAETEYTFFIRAYDHAGNAGPISSVAFTLPAFPSPPTLIDGGLNIPDPTGKTVRSVPGVMRYWVCSDVTKVNPATGNRIEDGYTGSGNDDYKKANPVWNSETNTISLLAARNEVVACQLVLERLLSSLTNVHLTVSDLAGPGGSTIAANPYVDLYQLHYVLHDASRYPDAAIPLSSPFPDTFSIPDANHNPSGTNQSVWIDLYVPRDAKPGHYSGDITVDADELPSPASVYVHLSVSPVVIPDELSFLIDLNGYSPHWAFGDQDLTRLRYFQLAQGHRQSLNILPYGWSANVQSDRAPTLTGAGPTLHTNDWSLIDQRFGPFLDGSAFTPAAPGSPYYGPGADTPVATFYTSFFESWPIHIQNATYGFDAAGSGGVYWDNLLDSDSDTFWRTLPDIEGAFPEGYKQGVRNVVKEWFEHAQAQGWHGTNFQAYLNHKYYYSGCAALWALEECETADDFRAMGFFHQLWRQGMASASAPDVQWHWRLDISDRWGQNYGQTDGLTNWSVMNGSSSDWYWPNLRYRTILLGQEEQWIYYGSGPAPQDRGDDLAKRFLQVWAQGLDGGIPYWNNFNTNWNNAEPLSIVYSGSNVPGFGQYDGAIAGVRMKLMRSGQQLIELANLLSAQEGWTRDRVTEAVADKYGDGSWNHSFDGMGEDELHRLHADLLAELESFIVGAGSCLELKKSDGTTLALFDAEGNLYLVGTLTESSMPAGTTGSEILLKNQGEAVVAAVYGDGNMSIRGNSHTNQTTLAPPAGSFVVKNAAADVIAYISPDGDLYIKGDVTPLTDI